MSTVRANAIVDNAGGNTATINGITPALASQAEAQAGSDNTKLMTPLRSLQAINSAPWPYVSSDQTITIASTLTLAHGLGRAPYEVQVLMKCVTAEFNYVAGDVIHLGTKGDDVGGGIAGPTIVIDNGDVTNIRVVIGAQAGAAAAIPNKTTMVRQLLTAANWRYIVRAR